MTQAKTMAASDSPETTAPSPVRKVTPEELAALANGLSSTDVKQRRDAGESNEVDRSTSRPVSAILRANLFTVFNGILAACAIAVLAVGDWRDAVFAIVLVLNLAIGVFSELRSKRELDSLAVLQSPSSEALRDGQWGDVDNAELVTDDVIKVKLGDQIPADGQVITTSGLEIDEAALTGEARPVKKQTGDALLSGTAVVAGSGEMLIEVIGADAWAQKITSEARRFSKVYSEIQGGIDKVLRWITMALPVVIALLLWSQLRTGEHDWRSAIIFTVAAVVGMIPQGLVLLTSLNFGVAAALLARRNVLVQELPAVEVLARVDVLCLDKTGTLTTGEIRGREIVPNPDIEEQNIDVGGTEHPTLEVAKSVLAEMVSDRANATAVAVDDMISHSEQQFPPNTEFIPFNSARKWSALVLPDATPTSAADGHLPTKGWLFGAPEILLNEAPEAAWAREAVRAASEEGRRSVCLVATDEPITEDALPAGLVPSLVVILEEDVREDAKATLEYFEQQGVAIKVISGDAPETVKTIAKDVGLQPAGDSLVAVDARKLPALGSEDFEREALATDVFGRVTPEQKRALVHAYQHAGHTVAMTGDGVNDALALKDADLGIAMGNAAPATKAVSRIVLLDGKFSTLPGVVAEGRRIIANMERVSSLFLSKTTYAMALAIVVSLMALQYPFLPRQLTYIGTFTIGVPAFFLSLSPNLQRYKPGFLRRTLLIAVPSGLILTAAALAAYLMLGTGELGRTGATIALIIGAMALLIVLARPWTWWRLTLVGLMIAGAVIGLAIPYVREFFALELPDTSGWITIVTLGVIAAVAIAVSHALTSKLREAKP